jgi:SAM-dependent methyltransferase
LTLREAWEANAEAWIEWARSPKHSHPFWRFHMPRFLEALPPPGRLTLDVGCGEGRLGRELIRIGHRVLGVDGSPALARAAVAYNGGFPAVAGDAAELPFRSGCADQVVSMMALQNIGRLEDAVAEVARVLEPGGHFSYAILHPFKVASEIGAPYFDPFTYRAGATHDGLQVELPTGYRPLSAYFSALERAGLLVEMVSEPQPDEEYVSDHPAMARCLQVPCVLMVRAVKR